MTDPDTLRTLQEVFRREASSFSQYVLDSFPWTTTGEIESLTRVRQMIQAERDLLAKVGQFLARGRATLPRAGAYPMDFTSFNFVGLHHLVPLLAEEQAREIGRLEADLSSAGGEGRLLLEALLDLKKRNLDALRRLAPAESAVAS